MAGDGAGLKPLRWVGVDPEPLALLGDALRLRSTTARISFGGGETTAERTELI